MTGQVRRHGYIHDVSLEELEEENRRLKKMYRQEKFKAEIVSEALEKKW
jgi:hypothetical protein